MIAPADSLEARVEDRIEAALAELGAQYEPPAGWEARVLAAIAEKPRRRWSLYLAPGLALAAAAAFAIWLAVPRPTAAIALDVRFDRGDVVRGDDHVVGEVVHVELSGGQPFRAIRIYRDEMHLVLSCPGAPACRISGDATAAELRLPQVGTYTIVALAGGAPLPALPGSYDADVAAAMRAGIAELPQRTFTVH